MKRLFLVLLLTANAMAQTNSYLRDHALTRGFMLGRPAAAKPTPDGKHVLFLRSEPRVPKMQLYEFEAATKQTRLLLSPEQLLKGAEENLSPEEKARRERMRPDSGTAWGPEPAERDVLASLCRSQRRWDRLPRDR